MATTTASKPILATATDNSFTLHDKANVTQVTYMPQRGGPVAVGGMGNGASLEYRGPEGSFSFSDEQITTEATVIGSLVTVTLSIVAGSQTLPFSVLVPEVRSSGVDAVQAFETVAIKASHQMSLMGSSAAGGTPTYQAMAMAGTARWVEIAD